MKLRTFPEDFIVEEYLNLNIKENGKYACFLITKKGWSIFDLISSISSRYIIPKNEISIAGIKDRHAITTSYISIPKNLAMKLIEDSKSNIKIIPNVDIKFIGFIDEQLNSDKIKYNKFTIVIRSIFVNEIKAILERVEFVKNYGVPNYFDDQRFGSVRHRKGFVAKELILDNYETAARILFEISRYDKKNVRIAKSNALKLLNDSTDNKDKNIDNYANTLKFLPSELKSFFQSIIKNNFNYINAFKSMDRRYLILLFHAYQSYLFNMLLSELLLKISENKNFFSVEGELNKYLFPEKLSKELSEIFLSLYLPIPSHKIVNEDNFEITCENDDKLINNKNIEIIKNEKKINLLIREILKNIEKDEKIEFEKISCKSLGLKLKNLKRRAFIIPLEFKLYDFEDDDFFKGKKKVKMQFLLDKGSYATMIIKGIFLQGKFGKAKIVSI